MCFKRWRGRGQGGGLPLWGPLSLWATKITSILNIITLACEGFTTVQLKLKLGLTDDNNASWSKLLLLAHQKRRSVNMTEQLLIAQRWTQWSMQDIPGRETVSPTLGGYYITAFNAVRVYVRIMSYDKGVCACVHRWGSLTLLLLT